MSPRLASEDRGQTPQDFAIGMSIFLLAVLTVLAFVPSIFTPFTAPETAVDGQADRASTAVMGELTVDGSSTTLSNSTTEIWFNTSQQQPTDDFAASLGLESYRDVNVTITRLDGSNASHVVELNNTNLTAGEPYDGEPSSTMVRIVRIPDSDECSPACRMVVRVW